MVASQKPWVRKPNPRYKNRDDYEERHHVSTLMAEYGWMPVKWAPVSGRPSWYAYGYDVRTFRFKQPRCWMICSRGSNGKSWSLRICAYWWECKGAGVIPSVHECPVVFSTPLACAIWHGLTKPDLPSLPYKPPYRGNY